LELTVRGNDDFDDAPSSSAQEHRKRALMVVYARKDSEDGPLVVIPPSESLWYKMYVENYYLSKSVCMQEKFRLRFCLPYKSYWELVQWVRGDPLFDRWCGKKIKNNKCSPVELLVLGSLRYLGRGWTFNDIEESTAISKDVH
jgi:hypothetical protein